MPGAGGGSCNLIIMGVVGKKKDRAAEVVARLRGISKPEALELVSKANILTVLAGVSRADADKAFALFQQIEVQAKISREEGRTSLDLHGLRVESFQCRNHPEREGVGICVACRRVFCVECSTKIDGVNHCRECLAKRQKTAQASATRSAGFLVRAIELALSTAVVIGSLFLVFGIFMLAGETHHGGKQVVDRDRMEAVSRALRSYRRDVGTFPSDQEGLEALVRKPDKCTGWQGPYVDSLVFDDGKIVDAFGSPIRYRAPRTGETMCVIGSPGGDRILQTDLATVVRPRMLPPGGEGAGDGDDLILFVD